MRNYTIFWRLKKKVKTESYLQTTQSLVEKISRLTNSWDAIGEVLLHWARQRITTQRRPNPECPTQPEGDKDTFSEGLTFNPDVQGGSGSDINRLKEKSFQAKEWTGHGLLERNLACSGTRERFMVAGTWQEGEISMTKEVRSRFEWSSITRKTYRSS